MSADRVNRAVNLGIKVDWVWVLRPAKPINSFLLELEDEMKEQFMIITQQLASISSIINQEDIEGCIKANSMAIQSLIQRIKEFGCDNFICTRLLTGINQYFKQANWNIDVF